MKVLVIVTEQKSFWNRHPAELDRFTLNVSCHSPHADVERHVRDMWAGGVSYTWEKNE